MTRTPDLQQEAREDIYFGQVVIIWARWFVILAAAMLALWSTSDTGDMTRRAAMVIGLMGVNFLLHGRSLMEKPANERLLMLTSIFDLGVIGLIIAFWGERGVESPLFVLYYPVLFAVSLVFAPRKSALFAATALVSYLAICIAAHPAFLGHADDLKVMAERVITLVATAGLGAYYWRVQRQRRHQAAANRLTLTTQF